MNLDFNLITPQIIYNLIDGNQGLIFGSVISYILAFNCYDIMKKSSSNKFIIELLENKNYSYKQTILNFISNKNIDYYTYFLKNCLDITEEENYYEEETDKFIEKNN